ncbi:MAG TPA: hypothetical protein VHM26_06335 [Chitinophagaceae bacterium]|nr:hypothetical protein [Chitinophagaceae bacterium]
MKTGIKIHCEDKQAVDNAVLIYEKFNTVLILGEYKHGFPLERAYVYAAPPVARPQPPDELLVNGDTKLWIHTAAAPRKV